MVISLSFLRMVRDYQQAVIYSYRPRGERSASSAREKSCAAERRANSRSGSWAYRMNMESSLIIINNYGALDRPYPQQDHPFPSPSLPYPSLSQPTPGQLCSFYKYICQRAMFRTAHRQPLCEAEEVRSFGCCMPSFLPCRVPYQLANPSRIRVYSEPKETASKGKKIELVSARRGCSQGKETTPTNRSLSREPNHLRPKHQKRLGSGQRGAGEGRGGEGMHLKEEEKVPSHGLKMSRLSTHQYAPAPKPSPHKETEPNSTNLPSFQYISQISLVSEEFVSQGSAINIASLITPAPRPPPSRLPTQPSEDPAPKNPISRLMDRKRYQQRTDRKKRLV